MNNNSDKYVIECYFFMTTLLKILLSKRIINNTRHFTAKLVLKSHNASLSFH